MDLEDEPLFLLNLIMKLQVMKKKTLYKAGEKHTLNEIRGLTKSKRISV